MQQLLPANIAPALIAGKHGASVNTTTDDTFMIDVVSLTPLLRVHAAGCPAPIAGEHACTCHPAAVLARHGRIAA